MTVTLEQVQAAAASGDVATVKALATQVLNQLGPTLQSVVPQVEAAVDFVTLDAEFDADEKALAWLTQESFMGRVADDIALAAPGIEAGVVQFEAWAVPVVSAFAVPPISLLIGAGLAIAFKIAIAAFDGWAKKRAARAKL